MTPRQACPRPSGFGRNLRSKTRWFTGFCNSHQVSHFATFFIDARAEISVAESRVCFRKMPPPPANGGMQSTQIDFLGAFRAGGSFFGRRPPQRVIPIQGFGTREACAPFVPLPVGKHVRGSFCYAGFDNDPSAGSPTETLLRLLLPLNDKVQWTSFDVAGSEPPTSPQSEHFTGPFNR